MDGGQERLVSQAARRLLEAAAELRGPQHVLDTAFEILGMPIELSDRVFHRIAVCCPEGIGPEELERHDKGDTQSFRRWMQTVEESREPVVDEEGGLRFRAMCYDVCRRGELVGRLTIFESKPFEPFHREIIKLMASALACVLDGEDVGRSTLSQQTMDNLVRNLIAGKMSWKELEKTEGIFSLPQKQRRRILVLEDAEGCNAQLPLLQDRCRRELGISAPIWEDCLVCLLEGDRAGLPDGELLRFLEGARLRGGLSRFFLELRQLRDHYLQARFALRCADKRGAPLLSYGACMVEDLVAHCAQDRDPLSFCRPEVLRLREYDEEYGTGYVATLDCYCQNLCSITSTARASFLHYNTIKYRLNKVFEICGVGEIKGRDLFEFWLSLRILEAVKN